MKDEIMKTIKFELEELGCPGDIAKIERLLLKQRGVIEANVLLSASKVKIKFRDWLISIDELAMLIENIGYPVRTAQESV